jgi:hypothetical protein
LAAVFGIREDLPDSVAAVNAEIDRLSVLRLTDLAAEVMVRGFGPGGPGGPGRPGTLEAPTLTPERVSLNDVARALTPAFTARAAGPEQQVRLSHLVAEALQALEHAMLVRVSWRGGMENYVATRAGRAAVETGAVGGILTAGAVHGLS